MPLIIWVTQIQNPPNGAIETYICLPFSKEDYCSNIEQAEDFRKCIDERIQLFPELFPPEILHGYRMKDRYLSWKLSIQIRRIEIEGVAFTVRPSFVMPYMTAFTKDIEKPLMLRKSGTPFWMLSYSFGRYPMSDIVN